MHTAMCVVGKNYRLQDIQLSKSVVRAGILSSAGTFYSTRFTRPMQAPRLENLSTPAGRSAIPPRARRARQVGRVVENTGLEPVTSWLQTRRSPS